VQVATKLSLEDFLNLQPSAVAPDDD
jgi:hypothetical protein